MECNEPISHPIAEQILDYLRRHPDAKDTMEGILDWWLPDSKIKPAELDLKEALAELLSRGLIIQHQAGGGKVYYGYNKSRG